MENSLYVSKYKNNSISKRRKIIYAYLFDFFICAILTFAFFAVLVNPVNNALPFNKTNIDQINNLNSELQEIVGETRIQSYDSNNKKLSDVEEDFKSYLLTMVKTTYYCYDVKFPNDNGNKVNINETFLNKGTLDSYSNYNYPLDNLSYFYLTFKSEEQSLNRYVIDNIDYSDKKEIYLYEKILDYKNDDISTFFVEENDSQIIEGLSRYQILTYKEDGSGTSNILMNKLINDDDSSITKTVYNSFLNHYYNALNEGINQIETNYTKYIDKQNSFLKYYNSYIYSYIVSYLISFVFGYIFTFIIFPLIFKEHSTVGLKVLKLRISRIDEMEPRWFNILLKDISLFLLTFSSITFSLFFMGQLNILTIGTINMLYFVLFSLILNLCSFIFIFISKKHQTFSLLVSSLVVKDMNDFESKADKEVINIK